VRGHDTVLTLDRCTVADNQVGIKVDVGRMTVAGSIIAGNADTAVFVDSGEVNTITNCTVTGNRSGSLSPVFCDGGASLTLRNCTISHNATNASGYAGGVHADASAHLILHNCVLWGNENAGGLNQIESSGATATVTHSNVQGGWPGTGNIDAEPLFVDPRPPAAAPIAEGNYHLLRGSPSIDSGDAMLAPDHDIDGDARPVGAGYDMGSDEHGPTVFADGFDCGDRSTWPWPE
jgi:hypothetical protein